MDFIKINDLESVDVNSKRGKAFIKKQTAETKKRLKAEAEAKEKAELEAKALAIAEAEALLAEAKDDLKK